MHRPKGSLLLGTDACPGKIFDICEQLLAPQGIAYVSYNTYPGWHMRGMIRDMLLYHAKQFAEPGMRVKQARNLLDFLAKATGKENSPYGLLLKNELEAFRRSSDSYLYHEHLEDVNEPIYFHQFVERAAAKGLRYLGEVDLRVMVPGNYPPEIENVLQMLSQDHVHMEQYMDFLRNRMFRQTLLCHKSLQPNYSLRWEQLRRFCIASPARVAEGKAIDIHSTEPNSFETQDGVTLSARDAIVKAAMVALAEVWPGALSFADLLKEARAKLAHGVDAAEEQTLGQSLLSFYASASTSLVELWLNPPKLTTKVSPKPLASALACHQANSKSRVTNLRHESVGLGDFERQLLRLLDGEHDRGSLVAAIQALVDRGELNVEKGGQPIGDKGQLGEVIRNGVEEQLRTMAKNGLLVG